MPVTADLGGKNYTLGRGRVFFDRFPANAVINALTRGDGERYLGNTTELNTTSTSETLDHFDSDTGVKVKDATVQLSVNRTGAFKCDNIDSANMALYFLGDVATVTQVAATAQAEQMTVKRGRFYQLGVDAAQPAGVRGITNVVIKKGALFATTVTALGNYQVDEAGGRIFIENDAAGIPDATLLEITYDISASTREQVISKSASIYGAIRFVADNATGLNRDYFFPYVKLTPDGDYSLKGEQWQEMSFKMEVLKKTTNIDALYIDGRPVIA